MSVTFDAMQAEFHVQARGGEPPLLLVRGAPVRDASGLPFHQGEDRLHAVGPPQAHPQAGAHLQAVLGERLLEALVEALHGRFVHQAELPRRQLREEGGAHSLVLRGRLDKAEEDLLPGEGDPQGEDHRILGEGLPIEGQRDELVGLQVPFQESLELFGAHPQEGPGDAGGAQAEDLRARLSRRVVAAAQAQEGLPEEASITCPGRLNLLVGGEGGLLVGGGIPERRAGNGELLVGEVNGATLVAPAAVLWYPSAPTVTRPCEAGHLSLERRARRLEPEGDEGLDERHRGVCTLRLAIVRKAAQADVFHLTLFAYLILSLLEV